MTVRINFQSPSAGAVTVEVTVTNFNQTVMDLISEFIRAQKLEQRYYYLVFNGTDLALDSTLLECGIVGQGENLRLLSKYVAA
jgi:hypothetical protein